MSTAVLSLSAASSSAASTSLRVNWGRFARTGLGTILASTLANALLYIVGGAVVAYDPQFLPLASVGGPIVMTVSAAILAVPLYAALLRFTRQPVRIFSVMAAVVFVLTMVPVFSYIPSLPGVTSAQIAMLVVMHFVAAGTIVRLLTSYRD